MTLPKHLWVELGQVAQTTMASGKKRWILLSIILPFLKSLLLQSFQGLARTTTVWLTLINDTAVQAALYQGKHLSRHFFQHWRSILENSRWQKQSSWLNSVFKNYDDLGGPENLQDIRGACNMWHDVVFISVACYQSVPRVRNQTDKTQIQPLPHD